MVHIKEQEAYLQLQRQELAEKEFLFESERSASVLMRQKSSDASVGFASFSDAACRYQTAEAMMSEAHALQVSFVFNDIRYLLWRLPRICVTLACFSQIKAERAVSVASASNIASGEYYTHEPLLLQSF